MFVIDYIQKSYQKKIVTREEEARWEDLDLVQRYMWLELKSDFKQRCMRGELSFEEKKYLSEFISANIPSTFFSDLPFTESLPLIVPEIKEENEIEYVTLPAGYAFYKGFHEFIYPDEEPKLFGAQSIIYYGRLTEARKYAQRFSGGIHAYATTKPIRAVYLGSKTIKTIKKVLDKLLLKTQFPKQIEYMMEAFKAKFCNPDVTTAQKNMNSIGLNVQIRKQTLMEVPPKGKGVVIEAPRLEVSKEIDNLCILAIKVITDAVCVFAPFVHSPYIDHLVTPEIIFFNMSGLFKRNTKDKADWTNWVSQLDFVPPNNFILSHFFYKQNFNADVVRRYALQDQMVDETFKPDGIVYFDVGILQSVNALLSTTSVVKFFTDFVKRNSPRILVLANISSPDSAVIRQQILDGTKYKFVGSKTSRFCVFYLPEKYFFSIKIEMYAVIVQLGQSSRIVSEYLFVWLPTNNRSSVSLELREAQMTIQQEELNKSLTLLSSFKTKKIIAGNFNCDEDSRLVTSMKMSKMKIEDKLNLPETIFAFSNNKILCQRVNYKHALNRGLIFHD